MFTDAPSLTQAQTVIIGLIATVVSQMAILLIAKKSGLAIGKRAATVIVFIVSVALSYAWSGIALSLQGMDFMEAANVLLENSVKILGFATVIYNCLLAQVFEKSGWGQDRVLPAKS